MDIIGKEFKHSRFQQWRKTWKMARPLYNKTVTANRNLQDLAVYGQSQNQKCLKPFVATKLSLLENWKIYHGNWERLAERMRQIYPSPFHFRWCGFLARDCTCCSHRVRCRFAALYHAVPVSLMLRNTVVARRHLVSTLDSSLSGFSLTNHTFISCNSMT